MCSRSPPCEQSSVTHTGIVDTAVAEVEPRPGVISVPERARAPRRGSSATHAHTEVARTSLARDRNARTEPNAPTSAARPRSRAPRDPNFQAAYPAHVHTSHRWTRRRSSAGQRSSASPSSRATWSAASSWERVIRAIAWRGCVLAADGGSASTRAATMRELKSTDCTQLATGPGLALLL